MKQQTPGQLGVCTWSLQARDADELVARVQATGAKQVQLALSAHRDDQGAWRQTVDALGNAGIAIASGMFGCVGEDYSTLEAIRVTGGVVPDQHWQENLRVATAAAESARSLGLTMVSFHAGFVPHDVSDPTRPKLVQRLLAIAEVYRRHGLELLFETGQESATTLLELLDELHRRGGSNIGVNFDPANMILYDMGDPIAALRLLGRHVRQVHIKDARRTRTAGQWGEEVRVGTGEVDWQAFVTTLEAMDFTGPCMVEREAGADRAADIAAAISHISGVMARRGH